MVPSVSILSNRFNKTKTCFNNILRLKKFALFLPLRYLNKDAQDFVYKNVQRILKPNGILIVDNQNNLYEMFALNNESIIFWNNLISSYCDLTPILKKDELLDKLQKSILTPIRKRKGHSFSGSCDVSSENPLTYKDKAKYHGFDITDILYPHCDILPHFCTKY